MKIKTANKGFLGRRMTGLRWAQRWALMSLLTGALMACTSGQAPQAEPVWTPQALPGSQWVDAGPTVGPSPVRLNFSKSGGISGKGACNAFNGVFELAGESVRLSQVASTRMFCTPEAAMAHENKFFQALNQTRSARQQRGWLVLLDEAGQVLWRFKPAN